MGVVIIGIILILIGCVIIYYGNHIIQVKKIDNKKYESYAWELQAVRLEIENENEKLNALKENSEIIKDYNKSLELRNKEKEELLEEQYQQKANQIVERYQETVQIITAEKEKELSQLDKLKETRKAMMEAIVRDNQILEGDDSNCLKIDEATQSDIEELERIRVKLHNPRVLSMLIWSTFFQKQLKSLTATILGTSNTVTGIYKITNLKTGQSYIGQAVDVQKRWAEHAKCGLGIDTPAHNKLYDAMLKDKLWNFSWDLLEECAREDLNDKERYYIEAYDSVAFGYNSIAGIKKI